MSGLKYIFVHGLSGWGTYDKAYKRMPYWGMRGGDLVGYFNYDRRNDRGDLVWNKDSEELRYKYLLMMTKV